MRRLLASLYAISLALASGPLWAASEGGHDGPSMALVYWSINFLILAGILLYFLRKPAKDFFASRATLIRTNIQQARDLKANAEKKYAEYEARLKSIEKEMNDLVVSLQKDGELERRRIVETATQQVATLKGNSERMLQQELRKAKEELKREAVNLATELAGELIRKNMTPEDQGRLVEQYLQKMEKLA
ncbi:ATP synthase F0 subunit B [Deltaproteobacteria bacterium PRO3]|nr:ATP synthase F0 subunit B [Deltaproteobacteria bacterium PRO3]